MTRDRVLAEVVPLVRRLCQDRSVPVDESSRFDADLGLDSLTRIDLVTAVEKHLGVVISDDDAVTMTSVGDLVDLLVPRGRR